MTAKLDAILASKRAEVASLHHPQGERKKAILDVVASLGKKPVIAEIKKASPSRGIINEKADPVRVASLYRDAGAGAISVLTDAAYFGGSFDYLYAVSSAVDIPVLCKDFIISEKQIELAYAKGADMILLIATILSHDDLAALAARARTLGLEILFEIHDAEEFEKVRGLSPRLVGINSRDLKRFTIDRARALRTLEAIGKSRGDCVPFIAVAESGIENAEDIAAFRASGADAFLVGTSLMTAGDPSLLLAELSRAAVGPCS